MNSEIRLILEAVKRGELSVDDAALKIKVKPFEDIGYAKVDLHRKVRQGAAEVIYGAGKNAEQISGIASAMRGSGQDVVLITRLSSEKAEQIKAVHPLAYHAEAGIGVIGELPAPDGIGRIVVATGGTSDIPVAEEASLTAEVLGNRVTRLYDVGVAGLHRLLAHLDDITLPHGSRHGRCDLSQHRIGRYDAHRTDDHIGITTGNNDGVLPGRAVHRSALQHGAGRNAVRANGIHFTVHIAFYNGLGNALPELTALPINNHNFHSILRLVGTLDQLTMLSAF